MIRVVPGVLLLAFLLAVRPAAAQLIPADAAWSTFETEHFSVTYGPGLEPLARRAAASAEQAYGLLAKELADPPPGRIEIIVTDNIDRPNGVATPFPRNRLVLYAHPPADDVYLSGYDDWLSQLVLHELVHAFHLEVGGGVWPHLRRVAGRNPFLYPQVFTPEWLIEGLATYAESRYTTAGRLRSAPHEMVLRSEILEDRFMGIDRVAMGPARWPAGLAPYVYGSFFVDHLARKYGPKAVSRLIEAVGRQLVPYRFDAAAKQALGASLSYEWLAWRDSLRRAYAPLADSVASRGLTRPQILSTAGRFPQVPRHSRDGRRIAYSTGTGRSESSLIVNDGNNERAISYSTGPGAVAWVGADRLLTTRMEFDGQYVIRSDLYEIGTEGERRLTRDARVSDPDVHPVDSTFAIAVASAGGTNLLVAIDLATLAIRPLVEPDFETQWSSPRFSPRGDRIAVARWQPGSRSDIVVLDTSGVTLRQITRDRAVARSPAWSPDGRYILFSSDRTGIDNLFARDLETGSLYQVTNVLTGAFAPEVSPDGRSILFSYYDPGGYRVARIPFAPSTWTEVLDEAYRTDPDERSYDDDRPVPSPPDSRSSTGVGGEARPYSARRTLAPTYWSPLLTLDSDDWTGIGAAVSGSDVIERHEWDLQLIGYPWERRLDAEASYQYRGWGTPILDIAAVQDWRVQAPAGPGANGEPLPELLRRDRRVEGTVSVVRRRWRSIGLLEFGADLRDVDFEWNPDGEAGSTPPEILFPVDGGIFAGIAYSSIRSYELSIGPQEGFRTGARVQARRYLTDPPGEAAASTFWKITSENRGFRAWDTGGFAPSVLATRFDVGVEATASAPGFTLGGSGTTATGIATDLGRLTRGSSYPVRGYPSGTQRGTRVLSGSLELRVPLALVERGYRLFPAALNRVWASAFVDGGAAWCPVPCRTDFGFTPERPDPLVSVGAETIVDLRLGYAIDVPLRFGVALPLVEPSALSPEAYLRIGRSF